jgi:hypothetical protein
MFHGRVEIAGSIYCIRDRHWQEIYNQIKPGPRFEAWIKRVSGDHGMRDSITSARSPREEIEPGKDE